MSGSARQAILGRIRASIARTPEEDARADARVAARLASLEQNIVPARSRGNLEYRVALFMQMAESVQTEVQRLERWSDVASVTSGYLRTKNLPQKLVMAPDSALDRAGWDHQPLLRTHKGTAKESDPVGLTIADAGVAETGTLLLASSAERPTLLAFLPETSIIVLPTRHVVGSYEDALALYSDGQDAPPRSINFITGPSRTGDIGQKLELGAHGPKNLLVLLVDED